MSKHVSLAQQLAQLEQPAPVDFDPEDAVTTNNEAENPTEEEINAARDHYLDVGTSALRNRLNESLPDPKYEGVRISRKQLEDKHGELSDGDGMSDDAQQPPVTSGEEDRNSEEEEGGNSDGERPKQHLQERTSDAIEDSNAAPPRPEEHDLSSTLKRARQEERKKGKAVARQLALFDGLLDTRIRLQKCAASMNRLPNAGRLPGYLADHETRNLADVLLSESLNLVDELFDLQEKLMATNEGLNLPARKRRKVDRDPQEKCDWEEGVDHSSSYFAELEATFHPHLLSTLQKWSNKVLAIAPSALLPSNRTKFSSKSAYQVKSAVQLVDEALLEREKLVARTRVWRGSGHQLGMDATSSSMELNDASDSVNVDIFDDADFYQALLRDVIDARCGSGGAGAGLEGVAADWRASQQQRKKARQKTVDTRASKGRKLRFDVHEKLQSFMAPAPAPGGAAWHEEQIDELFASLLGKGFPDADDLPEENRPAMDIDVEKALTSGFRVFG